MKEDSKMDMEQDKAMIKKAFREHDAQEHKGGKGTKLALKKGGNVKKMAMGGPTGLGQMVQNKSENFNRGNRMANFQNRPNSKMPFGQGQNSSQLGQLAPIGQDPLKFGGPGQSITPGAPTSGVVTNVSPAGPATVGLGATAPFDPNYKGPSGGAGTGFMNPPALGLPLPPGDAGGGPGGMPMKPGAPTGAPVAMMKKGGKAKAKAPVKKMASGGKVSSASSRGDGCATKGKTKGRMISMCGGGMYKKGK